jgi:excisionase family DNA binding protein
MLDQFMTIEEICEYLSIGRNSAYNLAKKMRYIKFGKRLMVPKADVEQYITNLLNEKQNNQTP